jgi:DNA-binding HxlR family transcriptional regulator
VMQELAKSELECLKKIAQDPAAATPHCSLQTLQRLESLGLVERVTRIRFPLVMVQNSYRLTASGISLLRHSGPSGP